MWSDATGTLQIYVRVQGASEVLTYEAPIDIRGSGEGTSKVEALSGIGQRLVAGRRAAEAKLGS